jgi:type IV pilus assembly protein PilO
VAIGFNINELSLDNIGSWPPLVKIIASVLVFVIVLVLGFVFDLKSNIQQLDRDEEKEISLREDFETKQHRAASLDAYKLQLLKIRKTFGELLQELPSKNEVPGLLEDISKSGLSAGLEFKLFDPQDEVIHDFYAELPIQIVVTGNYHQFGDFVSKLASLNRIVTLHDFDIKKNTGEAGGGAPGAPPAKKDNTANASTPDAKTAVDPLMMTITAKTYRYVEEAEAKKNAKIPEKGKKQRNVEPPPPPKKENKSKHE